MTEEGFILPATNNSLKEKLKEAFQSFSRLPPIPLTLLIFLFVLVLTIISLFASGYLDYQGGKISFNPQKFGKGLPSPGELNQEIKRQEGFFSVSNPSVTKEEVKKVAEEKVILRQILTNEAKNRGITVSEEEVQQEIASRVEKAGGQEAINSTLGSYNWTEQDFRQLAYFDLLERKLRNEIEGWSDVEGVLIWFKPETEERQKVQEIANWLREQFEAGDDLTQLSPKMEEKIKGEFGINRIDQRINHSQPNNWYRGLLSFILNLEKGEISIFDSGSMMIGVIHIKDKHKGVEWGKWLEEKRQKISNRYNNSSSVVVSKLLKILFLKVQPVEARDLCSPPYLCEASTMDCPDDYGCYWGPDGGGVCPADKPFLCIPSLAQVYVYVKDPLGNLVDATVRGYNNAVCFNGNPGVRRALGYYEISNLNCCSGGSTTIQCSKSGYNDGYASIPQGSLVNGGSVTVNCWLQSIAPPPTPTPTPTPPPGATPTPTPPPGCPVLDCTYPTTDPNCESGLTRCTGQTIGGVCLWVDGCSTCTCVPPGDGTPTPTPPETPTPTPPIEIPPPYYQTIIEAVNLTTNPEGLPNDCGGGPQCANTWSWPPTCGRPLRQTIQASPGDQILVRVCARNIGNEDMRHTNFAVWLNQALSGDKTLDQIADPLRFHFEDEYPGGEIEGPGIYKYHDGLHPNYFRIPYKWVRWDHSSCGDPGGDKWLYSCVAKKTFRFFVKNDASLLGKTASAKASLRIVPFVKPADYYRVESNCNLNYGTAGGFFDRQPECCWGDPTKAEGWYGRCTELNKDLSSPGNCRFGACNAGGYEEDFFFWSNWIKINVGSPTTITGNVYNDPGDNCWTSQKVSGAPWSTARMKLDGTREDLLGDGRYLFDSVTGGGHGLWMYKDATTRGLPSGWTCSSCATGNTCTGSTPGTASAAAGNIYNFYVKQGANAWFQSQGGDDHAQGSITSTIPAGASNKNFSRDLDSYPGVVSYVNSFSKGQGDVSSKGWLAQTGFNLSSYDYNYFYQKLGSPTTADFNDGRKPTSGLVHYASGDVTTSGGWSLGSGEKYIIFVNGNLRVGQKITVAQGGFLAFIVKGNITIDPNLGNNPASANRDDPNIQGFFLADGTFDTQVGVSTRERFVGKGIFKAGSFNLQRDLGAGANGNGKYSGELFIFDPNLLLNSPKELWGSSMSWLEVAP